MPKVSVIIPTYNAAQTVGRAISSVLAQSYKDFEVIVVDDGSSDNTRQVLASNFANVQYFYQTNQERSAARNHGIAMACGEYVAFLDADDWWEPNKLELQVTVMESDPTVGLVYSAYHEVTDTGQAILRSRSTGDQPGVRLFDQLVLGNIIGSPSFVMARRHEVMRVGGFDEALRQSEDWDLWLRLAAESLVAYIDKPLTFYRRSSGAQLQRLLSRDAGRAWPYIIEKLFASPKVTGCFGHLHNPAMARVVLRSAMIDCLQAEHDECTAKLNEAAQLDESLFVSPTNELADRVIEFGREVLPSRCTDCQGVPEFVDQMWDRLPGQVRLQACHWRRQTRGRYYAQRFFEAHAEGQRSGIRRAGLRVVLADASWLANRGFVSIWSKSILGRWVHAALKHCVAGFVARRDERDAKGGQI